MVKNVAYLIMISSMTVSYLEAMMALSKPWSQDLETFRVFIKCTEADPTKTVVLKDGTEVNQAYYVHAMTHIRYLLTMDQKCLLALWRHARQVLKKVPAEEAKTARIHMLFDKKNKLNPELAAILKNSLTCTLSRDPVLWLSCPLRRF